MARRQRSYQANVTTPTLSAHDWIKNYLENRKQYVQYKNVSSDLNTVKCGVPQGSILGPLLFLLYVNDIVYSSETLKFILYADDTSVFYSNKNPSLAFNTLNIELEKITKWLVANKLSINVKKTNYTIFKARQKKLTLNNSNIIINKYVIERKMNLKFLGVFIDENLNWKQHIHVICGKLSRSIGIITRSKSLLSQASLFKLYFSLIYPYLYYGNIVWGSTYPSNLNRINILHKRVIRIITNSAYDAHTSPLFIDNKLLNLKNIHLQQVGIFMYSLHHKLLPKTFLSMLETNSKFHSYNTRQRNDYRSQSCRTNIKKFTFSFEGLLSKSNIGNNNSIRCAL